MQGFAIHDGPIRNDEVRSQTSRPKLYCSTVNLETGVVCSCKHLCWHDHQYPYCLLQKSGKPALPSYRWSELLQLQDTKPNPECPRLDSVLNLLPEVLDAIG